ncbi:MAG: DUF721 domain-containing protein [Acidobacteria bacterium]|nr:DUF721 domain-containing protein [Acidobacteriota bacterium]MCW5969050.1 DUF721 domain-containing protein [Blastocatellales bacterium]
MESLLKLLPMMLRLAGDNEEVREQAVFAAWRITTGEQLASACRPFRLYRRQLVIATLDATWKRQMEAMSGEIIFRLNSLLGSPMVTFIEFRIDRAHVLAGRGERSAGFDFHHTGEIESELQPAADRIKDEDLREIFLRAAAKYLERSEG